MKRIYKILEEFVASPLTDDQRQTAAQAILDSIGMEVYQPSVSAVDGMILALQHRPAGSLEPKKLLVISGKQKIDELSLPVADRKSFSLEKVTLDLVIVEPTHAAADWLRQTLTWTAPQVMGLKTSAGLGDRLGLATPGHLQAVAGTKVVPYLAQQSIREMTRTNRTPDDVMDDATWGVFQAGWREGFGSDADHLKTPEDIDSCIAAGFTMFTFDPGDHVNPKADTMEAAALAAEAEKLPWDELETTLADFKKAHVGESIPLGAQESARIDEAAALRAMVKYGKAIAHSARMYRHLAQVSGSNPFEVEVSVDETETPTTIVEHYLIASELRRLGVTWVSLAPRFIGEFEKGIDYKGDLKAFEASYAQHAAIAEAVGPYKLSIHSGSDKFSVYPIAARLSQGKVHLKTAGTSYLEALRVIARKDPALFRKILDFAFERFDEDKATYHISAVKENIPTSGQLSDDKLETVLDQNDGRQLLHVTYGSVLTWKDGDSYRFRDAFMKVLEENEDEHYKVLHQHLGKHVQPLA